MTRHELCERVFYGLIEFTIAATIAILVGWYLQSKQPVVDFHDNPGYRIIAVTEHYIEVKWIEAALITDCPGRVEPIIWGERGSHALESYPFVVQHARKTFTRRYEFPEDGKGNSYLPYGDYELRINMISVCNPLFEGRQILRVPFRYDPRGVVGD
jgi:hypothetical protein